MTVTVTWWGHATTTIALGGRRVLTDPVLTDRVAHLRRHGATPCDQALDADVVVLSHLHHDHVHVPSLRRLTPGVRVVGPTGTAGVLARALPGLARRVEEVEPGDVVDVGDVRVRAVPAEHDGRRSPVSRHRGPALGYVLAAGPTRVWFAGDTGLFDAMAGIGPVDVAVVPVGGWGPTLGPGHLDPEQAAEAVRRVGARDAVPVHYATFWPAGLRHLHPPSFARRFAAPGPAFAAALVLSCPRTRVQLLAPGGTVALPGPGT